MIKMNKCRICGGEPDVYRMSAIGYADTQNYYVVKCGTNVCPNFTPDKIYESADLAIRNWDEENAE